MHSGEKKFNHANVISSVYDLFHTSFSHQIFIISVCISSFQVVFYVKHKQSRGYFLRAVIDLCYIRSILENQLRLNKEIIQYFSIRGNYKFAKNSNELEKLLIFKTFLDDILSIIVKAIFFFLSEFLKHSYFFPKRKIGKKEKRMFSVYFLLFPYPKNFSHSFSSHWKKQEQTKK